MFIGVSKACGARQFDSVPTQAITASKGWLLYLGYFAFLPQQGGALLCEVQGRQGACWSTLCARALWIWGKEPQSRTHPGASGSLASSSTVVVSVQYGELY